MHNISVFASPKGFTESDEKSLLLEIQDIDQSMHSKEYVYFSGNLFSSLINEKVINDLHNYLTKKGMYLQEGYNFLSGGVNNKKEDKNNSKSSNRVETFNEKMQVLSKKNVFDYDLNKYRMLMKRNKNRWSLFKRSQPQYQSSNDLSEPNNTHLSDVNSNISIHEKVIESRTKQQSRKKSQMSTFTKNTPTSLSKDESRIKVSQNISNFLKPQENKVGTQKQRKKANLQRKMLTQISELDNPEKEDKMKISKFQLKNILKRQGLKLVFMWIPPTSYPHFNGLFTYSVSKSLTTCKLKKYFLFRRSLNRRLFTSIMQYLSKQEDRYIESLELLTSKQDYIKIFQPIGWKMKSMEGIDRIRIKFTRKED